jgi:hypothetical protein
MAQTDTVLVCQAVDATSQNAHSCPFAYCPRTRRDQFAFKLAIASCLAAAQHREIILARVARIFFDVGRFVFMCVHAARSQHRHDSQPTNQLSFLFFIPFSLFVYWEKHRRCLFVSERTHAQLAASRVSSEPPRRLVEDATLRPLHLHSRATTAGFCSFWEQTFRELRRILVFSRLKVEAFSTVTNMFGFIQALSCSYAIKAKN